MVPCKHVLHSAALTPSMEAVSAWSVAVTFSSISSESTNSKHGLSAAIVTKAAHEPGQRVPLFFHSSSSSIAAAHSARVATNEGRNTRQSFKSTKGAHVLLTRYE